MKKIFTEEDIEETAEDEGGGDGGEEVGRLDQPAAKKLRGDDASNSDDELPEVFTMTEGKSIAQQLRSDERASGRRIATEVKKKRQEREANRKNEKIKLDLLRPADLTVSKDRTDPEQSVVNGLLDDSIVQFLSACEKAELVELNADSSLPENIIKAKRRKLKKDDRNGSQNDRVQIIDLSRESSSAEERNALKFKHGHLYGDRLKRDPAMLRKLARTS